MISRCWVFIFLSVVLTAQSAFPMGGGGYSAAIRKRQQDAACESMATPTTCSPQQKMINRNLIESMVALCVQQQKETGCDTLREDITKSESAEAAKSKVRTCSEKSVCGQDTDWNAIGSKCLDGMKQFGKEVADKVVKMGQAIKENAIEEGKCNRNEGGRKQKMVDDFNKAVPDFMQINLPKNWVESANCSEISLKISGMYQNIQDNLNRRMIAYEQQNPLAKNNIDLYKDPKLKAYKEWFLANGEKQAAEMRAQMEAIANAFKAVPALLKQLDVKFQCYNDETRAEIACHAATAIVASAATGFAGATAVKALTLLARASGSVKVAKAIYEIEKMDKLGEKAEKLAEKAKQIEKLPEEANRAEKLAANARKAEKVADKMEDQKERVLKAMDKMRGEVGDQERQQLVRALKNFKDRTPEELDNITKAMVEAHNICADSGFKMYSADCLRKKAKVLKEAGISQADREYLMRNGIAGQYATVEGVPDAAVTGIRKAAVYLFKNDLTPDQVKAVWAASNGTREGKIAILLKAGFTQEQAEKIAAGELQKAAVAAKDVVLDQAQNAVGKSTQSAAPAQASASIADKQKALVSQIDTQDANKIQAAFDDSRKAIAEDVKKNPDSYRKSPSKVIDSTLGGLPPKEAADFIEAYAKEASGGDLSKMISAIDQKAASEASKSSISAGYNSYKLQELKVELLERKYHAKYKDRYNEIDMERFINEDEAGFDAFKEAQEKLEALKQKGARLKWPK